MSESYTIEIARHSVRLSFEQNLAETFLKEFSKKYALFLSDREPQIHLDVQLSDDIPKEFYPWPKITFKGNLITIKDDCLSGTLDWSKKTGKVNLNPVNPLYPLGIFLRNLYIYLLVLEDKGVALHAVGILKDEEVYVFIGPSGAGKSTVAGLSYEKIVLSDDLLLIKKVDGKFKVWPTPNWDDKQMGLPQNKPYPINSIYKLIQDKQVYLEKFSHALALADIFTLLHVPIEQISFDGLLATFAELTNSVSYYGLHFLPEPSFWNCIEELEYASARKNTCQV